MKNPFMSLWLSAANRAVGTGTGLWKAAVRRQQTAALNEASKVFTSFWLGGAKTGAGGRRRKRK